MERNQSLGKFLALLGVVLLAGALHVHAAAMLFDTLSSESLPDEWISLDSSSWAGQDFNSGSATLLTGVRLNLFRSTDAASGSFFVRLYSETVNSLPDDSSYVTLASGLSIASLTTVADLYQDSHDAVVTLSGLSTVLAPNTYYFIVVGGESAATPFQWGYTAHNTGVGANDTYFTASMDGGASWSSPSSILPQRMEITAVPEPASTLWIACGLCFGAIFMQVRATRKARRRAASEAVRHDDNCPLA